MRRISSLLLAALSCWTAIAATRPRYGGVLRVEIRESIETPDPPQSGPGLGDLHGPFTITRWEPGRRAVFTANENAPGGRPFLDGVEVDLARPLRDQSIDLELGKTDIAEFVPSERRAAPARRVWSGSPSRLVVLVFGPRVDDARVRETLALAVDRTAIHTVLLQRQGEITGALLPQWLSGYAFVFPAAADTARAKAIGATLPAASRMLSLGVEDRAWQAMADRIALNARDGGLTVSIAPPRAVADVRLVEIRIASGNPARALADIAQKLGLPEPPRADSPEGLFSAERSLLDGFRVIPLFHLPDVYGVGPRVRGGPGIGPLGEWRFENLWVEGARP